MRWCKKCRSATHHNDECGTCVINTATGHMVGVKLVEAFVRTAASTALQEYVKKAAGKVLKEEIKRLVQEAVKQEAQALAAVTSPLQWLTIVTEFVSYHLFKAAGASEEEARRYSSWIGFGTATVAGAYVGMWPGLAVGGAAWIIGHAIPNPLDYILPVIQDVLKKKFPAAFAKAE